MIDPYFVRILRIKAHTGGLKMYREFYVIAFIFKLRTKNQNQYFNGQEKMCIHK